MAPRLEEWISFQFGTELTLANHFLFLIFSIVLSCLVLILYQRKFRLNERALYTFLCLSIPGILLGAKLIYLIQFPWILKRGWDFWLGGGSALYGGLIGVLVAGAITSRIYQESVRPYLDGLALALSLGLFTGRIGCFLSGCNWGKVTDLPWGVRFPIGSHAYNQQLNDGLLPEGFPLLSMPVHPTQVYEAGLGLSLFLAGVWWIRRRRYEGQWFIISVLVYAVFRFLVEFIRADQGDSTIGPVTYAQGFSLLLSVGVLFLWFRYSRGNRQT